jgi:hypothetical protein
MISVSLSDITSDETQPFPENQTRLRRFGRESGPLLPCAADDERD